MSTMRHPRSSGRRSAPETSPALTSGSASAIWRSLGIPPARPKTLGLNDKHERAHITRHGLPCLVLRARGSSRHLPPLEPEDIADDLGDRAVVLGRNLLVELDRRE